MRSRFLLSLIGVGLCTALLGVTGCNKSSEGDGDSDTTADGVVGTWMLSGATGVRLSLVGHSRP
ncbi:MAG: hypothetical protein HQ523_07385 [Lentisphaerae bacterium]|nr:hypothetical protein [Lentisphaerota bacterium]